jgi:hypothetical protein
MSNGKKRAVRKTSDKSSGTNTGASKTPATISKSKRRKGTTAPTLIQPITIRELSEDEVRLLSAPKLKHQFPQRPAGSGLADVAVMQDYIDAMRDSWREWPELDRNQRLDRLGGKANQLLAKFGVPEVNVADWGAGETASFMRGSWTMSIGEGLLEKKEVNVEAFARLAGSIYHEARHAEQTFRVARKLAAEGESIDSIASKLRIPKDRAAAAVAAKKLSRKETQQWQEAEAWQHNLLSSDDEEALANHVNSELNISQRMYQLMGGVWAEVEKKYRHGSVVALGKNPEEEDVREVIAKGFVSSATTVPLEGGPYQLGGGDLLTFSRYCRDLQEFLEKNLPDDFAMWHEGDAYDYWKVCNAFAQERSKQAYRQYAGLVVEQDAWEVNGLIEAGLGVRPQTLADQAAGEEGTRLRFPLPSLPPSDDD